jgi:sugar lactone lactonase YvrE
MTRPTSFTTMSLLLALASCTADDGDGSPGDGASSSSEGTTSTLGTTVDPDSSGGSTTVSPTTTAGSSGSSSDEGSTAGESSSGGPGEVEVELLVELDAAAFELPEGLFIDGDEAVVGFAFTGAIERIALGDGTREPFAATPTPPQNTSFVTGITLDAQGRVYAAVVSFTADLQAGIYRADGDGGDATLWASDPAMLFPNGFAWDDDARLFVSDSTGGVSTVDENGTVTPWFVDDQLAGDPTACDQDAMFTIGPNGIAWTPEALWIASSDQGILARVAIDAEGEAGALELVAGPDCALGGLDGITLDDDGSILGAVNRQDKLVRITQDGTVTTLFEGEPLAFPATLELGGSGDDRALYVTNFALDDFLAGAPASPSIARVRLVD